MSMAGQAESWPDTCPGPTIHGPRALIMGTNDHDCNDLEPSIRNRSTTRSLNSGIYIVT